MSKHLRSKAVAVVCGLAAVVASASVGAVATLTTPAGPAIRIQTYTGVSPILYYAGSVCSSGHLTLDPSDTPDRQKLLWAAVLSAKAMSTKVSFDYDFNGDDCVIRVFAVMPN